MTITEFARSRNEQVNTVSKYIREHPEFEGHIKQKGKQKILDDKALELLDVKYPLPKPVTIINGIPEDEHYKALQEKDEQIQKLQQAIIELQKHQSDMALEIGELRAQALLIEDKQRQIDELKNRNLWERIINKS